MNNASRSEALLERALDNPDWNVRRYSAFTLGQMCARRAIPALRRALWRELPIAEHSRATTIAPSKQTRILSVVDAIIIAMARINTQQAVIELLSLYQPRQSFSNYYANHALNVLFPDAPVLGPVEADNWWDESYSPAWKRWFDSKRRSIVEACP
jgi:hypothetical protein